ncbi:Ig-like domain-containing protein [Pseudomonas sp. ZM23]|nr:Ig-like domain-containing protein [Pseudomonas triclosanedens]
MSASDGITSNGTINVTGLEAGASWQYSLDGGTTWLNGTGTQITGLAEGATTVQVRQTDAAGNVSPVATLNVTVDTAAPAAPSLALESDTGVSASDGITSNGTINVTGLEAGASWQYSLDGGTTWVDGSGTQITGLAEGANTVQVRQTDAAGNVSPVGTLNVTVDTAAAAPGLALESDTGVSASDGITSNGTINVTGLEAGASWQYSLDGGTTWVDGSGTQITGLAEGANTVQVRQTDAAGNVSPVSTLNVSVDTSGSLLPDGSADPLATATVTIIHISHDSGASDSDYITNDNTLVIQGTSSAPDNTGIAVYVDGVFAGYAIVTGGAWGYPIATALADGEHDIEAKLVDAAGNVVGPVSVQVVTIDTVASGTPTAQLDPSSDTGILGDGITASDLPVISGTAEAGAVVEVTINGHTYTATADAAGRYSVAVTDPLPDNTYTPHVKFTDKAGNIAEADGTPFTVIYASAIHVTLDTLTDNVGVQQGTLSAGQSTDDRTLDLSGTLSASLSTGDVVAIYDGSIRRGTATVTGTNWTYFTGLLTSGAHSFTARVENTVSGQYGPSSPAFAVIESSVAIGSVGDDIGLVLGAVDNGAATDDHLPTLTGTLGAALGAGEKVAIYDGATKLGNAVVNGTTWTFTPSTPLADGAHILSAHLQSSSGTDRILSGNYTINVISPVPPTQTVTIATVADNVGVQQGNLTAGQSTDDTTLALSGTLSAGLNVGDVVAIYDGSTRLGTATVTGTTWTYTTGALASGAHNLTARVENPVSGLSGSSSPAFSVIESSVAIGSVSDDAGLVVGAVANNGTTDDTTPTLSGTLGAALGAGEKVAIYDGATRLGDAVVNGTTWTFTPTTGLAVGAHTLSAHIQDGSGTDRIVSTNFTINTITAPVAPTQTATITTVADNVGVQQGNLTAGQSTDDTTLALSGTLSASFSTGDVVAIYDGSTRLGTATITGSTTWTYTTGALASGAHNLTARVENSVSGLSGSSSPAFSVVENGTTIAAYNDVGTEVGNGPSVRYILVQRENISGWWLRAGEIEVYSGGVNVARGKTVTTYNGTNGSGAVDGNPNAEYSSGGWSQTEWLQIDLGGYYTVESIHYVGGLYGATDNNNLTILGGTTSLSGRTLADLTADSNVVNYGRTPSNGPAQGATFTLDTGVSDAPTADHRPEFSGHLDAALGAGEKVAIYDGATKIGEATVNGTSWTFTPTVDLSDGVHTLSAHIQSSSGTDRILSGNYTINVVSPVTPTQTVTIDTAVDNVGVQQGNLTAGQSTDDTTLALSGTLSAGLNAGDVVAIYDGSTRLGTATVTGTAWTYTTGVLVSGAHNLTARVENPVSGQNGPSSPAFAALENAVAISGALDDVGAVVGAVADNGTTDDATPTLSGTLGAALAAGEKVAIYDGTTRLGDAVVNGTTWTFTPGTGLAQGAHTLSAHIQDGSGNDRILSGNYTINVASPVAPTQAVTIVAVADNFGAQKGNLTAGQSTDDSTLDLSGTLSAGLNAGDVVAIYDGSTRLGTATVTGTNWTYFTGYLESGAHSLTARVENPASGLNGPSSPAFVAVENAVAISGAVDDVGAVVGAVDYGDITDDTMPTLNGELDAALASGEKVAIYDGVTKLGDAVVNGTGWTFTPSTPLADGAHKLSAHIQDGSGNDRVVSASYTVKVASPVPPTQNVAIVVVEDNVGVQQGNLTNLTAGSTDDTTLALSGILSAGLNAGDIVAIYDGATRLGIATVTGTAWTYTTGALASGAHNFTARVENPVSGQNGPSSPAYSTIENGIGFAVTVDQGNIRADSASTTQLAYNQYVQSTGSIIGTGLVSGITSASQVAAMSGGTQVGGVSAYGVYLFDNSTPGVVKFWLEKVDEIFVKAVQVSLTNDAEGNIIATVLQAKHSSADQLGIIDFNVSGIQSAIANSASQGGYGVSSLTLQVVANALVQDHTPTLEGTLDAALGVGEKVSIFDGATKIGEATVNGTHWTFTPATPLAEGAHNLSAHIQDGLGHDRIVSGNVVINVVSPAAPAQTVTIVAAVDNVGVQQGNLTAGQSTDDTTLALSGTLSAGLNAGDVVAIYDGSTRLGTATVTGTTWTYTTGALASGAHSLTARVENIVSGLSGSSSPAFAVIESSVAIGSVGDDVGAVVGAVADNGTTDDATPTLSGTLGAALAAGEKVAIYDGTTRLGDAVVNGTTWTFTPGTGLAQGAHTLSAHIQDGSGNDRILSGNYTINVASPLAPTQTVTIVAVADNAGVQQGNLSAGQSTDDTTLALSGTLSAGLHTGDVVAIYDGATRLGTASVTGNTWSYTTAALQGGLHNLTVRVENPASGLNGPAASFDADIKFVELQQVVVSTGAQQGNLAANGATSGLSGDSSPVLSGLLKGALDASERIAVYDGTTYLGAATVADGVWAFNTSGLAAGQHQLRVVLEDSATHAPVSQASYNLTVDTAVPHQRAAITSVGGESTSGVDVHNRLPQIVGTLSANLTAGQKVGVYDNGELLGYATVSGSGWTFTPAYELAGGNHSITARVLGGVDGVASPAFSVYENTIDANAVSVSSATPTLTGSVLADLRANQVVGIYDGDTRLGSATLNANHTWTYSVPAALANGLHHLSARIEDSTTHVPVVSDTVDCQVGTPAVTTTLMITSDGSVAYTDDGGVSVDGRSPTLSGQLSGALLSSEVVAIYDGSTRLGTATVNGTTWTFTDLTNTRTGLQKVVWSDGLHNLTARVESTLSGAQGPASPAAVVNLLHLGFDTIQDDVGGVQGNLKANSTATEFVTDDGTPLLGGTLSAAMQPGESLVIYDGTTRLGTATLNGTTWSFASTLAVGTHQLTAVVEDASGNAHVRSTAFTVNVEPAVAPTQAATITAVNDPASHAAITDGGTTSAATVGLNGTVSAALATGEQVVVYDGSSRLGVATMIDATHWSYTTSNLGLGGHALTARVETTAGQQGAASSAWDVAVQGDHPTQVVTLDGPQPTAYSSGGQTSYGDFDGGVNHYYGRLSDGLGANEKLAVYDGATLVGYATVSGLSWTMDVDVNQHGSHAISARVVDTVTHAEGTSSNVSSFITVFGSDNHSFTINNDNFTTSNDVSGWSGPLQDGAVTDSTSVSVGGSIDYGLGAAVNVYDNGSLIASFSQDDSGWGGTINGLSLGEHTLEFRTAVEGQESGVLKTMHLTVVEQNGEVAHLLQDVGGLKTLNVAGHDQIIDLNKVADLRIDSILLDGTGANTLKLSAADVLQSGVDQFNNASGWTGLVSGGRHQMVITGGADDTVQLGQSWNAADWTRAGTVTHGGHTYDVYNSTNGQSQVLLDEAIMRSNSGAVL